MKKNVRDWEDDEEISAYLEKLLDKLEDDDDVQNVYHNWDEE